MKVGKNRSVFLQSASIGIALMGALAAPAFAQAAEQSQNPGDPGTPSQMTATASASADAADGATDSTGEIVVTGSRIKTGFNTPTPVAVATGEQLRKAAPTNIADALNQLPIFNGSSKTVQGTNTNAGGATGQNLLNLRGLSPKRSLVLLDGRRLPATNSGGSVDVNVIPQGLVERVDVVTGGASAAYGSDAVAGVINFVLNTRFEGLKGDVEGGISNYGDMPLGGANLSWGHSFADGRGHIIAGASYFHQDGVPINKKTGRSWFDDQSGLVTNPVKGGISYIIIPHIRSSIGTFGGLITSGPLKGTQFLSGGASAPFNYGTTTGAAFQSGGDGAPSYIALSPDQTRYSGFAHAEFELNDHVTFFGEGLYSRSHTLDYSNYLQNVGAALQYTIFRDNAYLPADIAARMDASGVKSFTLGRFEGELPISVLNSKIDVYHGVAGVRGDMGGSWKWDLSYDYGRTDLRLSQDNLTRNRSLYASVDAVKDASGKIVCRSTSLGMDPNCVPRNILGPQPANDALNSYLIGNSVARLRLQEHVVSANVSGDLGDRLRLAAPISVAAGLEYRYESANQQTDAVSSGISDLTGLRGYPTPLQGKVGGWRTYNPQPFHGSYDIMESYLEVGVPVLADLPFAKSLDLNAAVRHSIYSQSGGVTTWKIGGVWEVVDGLRFRTTYSQDIRGPNVLELFNPGSQTLNNLTYKGVSTASQNIASGNPDLQPERARTFTVGGVVQPRFATGLQASLDYYHINVSDAIGSVSEQRILDLCAAGNASLCSLFQVTSAGTLIVHNKTLNLSKVRIAGLDGELSYRSDIAGGRFTVRLIGNHALTNDTTTPGSPVLEGLGSTNTPKWGGVLQATYDKDGWGMFAQERYISKSKIDPSRVEGVEISHADNSVPAVLYTDLTLTRDLHVAGKKQQIFVTINNLFNKQPPLSPGQVTSFSFAASNAYDQVGRYFTTGVRFNF